MAPRDVITKYLKMKRKHAATAEPARVSTSPKLRSHTTHAYLPHVDLRTESTRTLWYKKNFFSVRLVLTSTLLMFLFFYFGLAHIQSNLSIAESTDSFTHLHTSVKPVVTPDTAGALESFTSGGLKYVPVNSTALQSEVERPDRKQKIIDYLVSKRSPIASDDRAIEALLNARHLPRILGISFVESNFCKFQTDNNCSGIGVEPGNPAWREYDSFANWVIDLDYLIERRYKDWTPEQMRNVYVQPGSDNWVDGVYQVENELRERGIIDNE